MINVADVAGVILLGLVTAYSVWCFYDFIRWIGRGAMIFIDEMRRAFKGGNS